jgi:hypothetical protein
MALPPYISWTGFGSSCGEPPGVFTNAMMHMFGVAGDIGAMKAMVDRFLRPVASPKSYVYEPCTNSILLTVLDIERCSSTEVIGWVPGRECALWIPLLEVNLNNPFHPRLVMWSPYIFISYGIGMVTGREVWGWSKALATIGFPGPGSAAPEFDVDTLIFRQFDKTQPGTQETLLRITGDGPLSSATSWAVLSDAVDGVFTMVTGLAQGTFDIPFKMAFDFPAIALKQFRDSSSPGDACFQAVVNSPVHIDNFLGGGLHNAQFELEVATCDSHPIVNQLLGGGAQPNSTTVPITWAAWVNFDFSATAGSVIARTV